MSKRLEMEYGERVSYEEGQWVAVIWEYPSHATATIWQASQNGGRYEKEHVLEGNDPDGFLVYYDEKVKVFDTEATAVAYCENAGCDTVLTQD